MFRILWGHFQCWRKGVWWKGWPGSPDFTTWMVMVTLLLNSPSHSEYHIYPCLGYISREDLEDIIFSVSTNWFMCLCLWVHNWTKSLCWWGWGVKTEKLLRGAVIGSFGVKIVLIKFPKQKLFKVQDVNPGAFSARLMFFIFPVTLHFYTWICIKQKAF